MHFKILRGYKHATYNNIIIRYTSLLCHGLWLITVQRNSLSISQGLANEIGSLRKVDNCSILCLKCHSSKSDATVAVVSDFFKLVDGQSKSIVRLSDLTSQIFSSHRNLDKTAPRLASECTTHSRWARFVNTLSFFFSWIVSLRVCDPGPGAQPAETRFAASKTHHNYGAGRYSGRPALRGCRSSSNSHRFRHSSESCALL